MFNKSNEDISIWTNVPGLSKISECRPAPLKNFLPNWWKNIPHSKDAAGKNIKDCPSFLEMFNQAIVIPMWTDTLFSINNGIMSWETSSEKFSWEPHEDFQFLDHVVEQRERGVISIMKAVNPWSIKTPKGVSCYQTSNFYQFSKNYTIMDGIIRTDSYNHMSIPIMIHPSESSFLIERGEPFVTYIPFKRNKFKLNIREKNKDDEIDNKKSELIVKTKFSQGYLKNNRRFS